MKVFAALIFILGTYAWYNTTIQYSQVGSDFIQDYGAASAWIDRVSPYGEELKRYVKERLDHDGIDNFHPPFNVFLFAPFTLLSLKLAFFLWNFISLCLYLGIVWIALGCSKSDLDLRVKDRASVIRSFAFSLSPLWYPFINCIGTGQSSVVLVTLILGGLSLVRREFNAVGALLIAVASAIKLFPGFIALYLLLKGERRAFIYFLIFSAGIWAACFGFLGGDVVWRYFAEVAPRDAKEWGVFPLNASLTGFLTPILTENSWSRPLIDSTLLAQTCVGLASLLILLGYLRALLREGCVDSELGQSLTITTMLLLSPLTWMHIFPILIPTLIYLLRCSPRGTTTRWVLLLIFIALSVPDVELMNWLVSVAPPGGIPWYVMLVAKTSSWGLLALWWLLIRKSSRRDF